MLPVETIIFDTPLLRILCKRAALFYALKRTFELLNVDKVQRSSLESIHNLASNCDDAEIVIILEAENDFQACSLLLDIRAAGILAPIILLSYTSTISEALQVWCEDFHHRVVYPPWRLANILQETKRARPVADLEEVLSRCADPAGILWNALHDLRYAVQDQESARVERLLRRMIWCLSSYAAASNLDMFNIIKDIRAFLEINREYLRQIAPDSILNLADATQGICS